MKKMNKKGQWSDMKKVAVMVLLVLLGAYIIYLISNNIRTNTKSSTSCETLPGVNGTCVATKVACDELEGFNKGNDSSCNEKDSSKPYCCVRQNS